MARKKDLKNHRKRISENNHTIINEEISSAENLENQDLSIIVSKVVELPGAGLGWMITVNFELNGAN